MFVQSLKCEVVFELNSLRKSSHTRNRKHIGIKCAMLLLNVFYASIKSS